MKGLRRLLVRFQAWLDRTGLGSIARFRRRPLGKAGIGFQGERAAARYLKRQGYRVVTRNFRAAGAEIDLIALDGPTLVFVEVKSRTALSAGRPEEAVDLHKQYRLRRAAEIFSARHHARGRPTRFDVVAISGRGTNVQFELFKDAF